MTAHFPQCNEIKIKIWGLAHLKFLFWSFCVSFAVIGRRYSGIKTHFKVISKHSPGFQWISAECNVANLHILKKWKPSLAGLTEML